MVRFLLLGKLNSIFMKRIFKKMMKEPLYEADFLDEFACECMDWVEDYECSSILGTTIAKPPKEVFIVDNLWQAYNSGVNSGLVGLIKHSELPIENLLTNLNHIKCAKISQSIQKLQKIISDIDLETKDLSDEERREIYFDLAEEWKDDNSMIYSEVGNFIPKLKKWLSVRCA